MDPAQVVLLLEFAQIVPRRKPVPQRGRSSHDESPMLDQRYLAFAAVSAWLVLAPGATLAVV
jgi:hypothetical protein